MQLKLDESIRRESEAAKLEAAARLKLEAVQLEHQVKMAALEAEEREGERSMERWRESAATERREQEIRVVELRREREEQAELLRDQMCVQALITDAALAKGLQ